MAKQVKQSKEVEVKVKRAYKKRTPNKVTDAVEIKPIVRSVGVKFSGNYTVYNYLVEGLDVATGDYVVVLTPSAGLQVVTVVEVSDKPVGTKYIVDKVDLAAHQARIDKAEKKAKLTAELMQLKAKIDVDRALNDYAKDNKEFAAILKELRSLT